LLWGSYSKYLSQDFFGISFKIKDNKGVNKMNSYGGCCCRPVPVAAAPVMAPMPAPAFNAAGAGIIAIAILILIALGVIF
jgi:hypothetical protein